MGNQSNMHDPMFKTSNNRSGTQTDQSNNFFALEQWAVVHDSLFGVVERSVFGDEHPNPDDLCYLNLVLINYDIR